MKPWEATIITPQTVLREAIARVEAAGTQMALIVDAESRLIGTLTDGDVRRGLLAGVTLNDAVEHCMCRTPTVARVGEPREAILAKMRQFLLHQIPVLDEKGRIVDLKLIDDYLVVPARENWAVIMAGGLGTRLKELTHELPKPMLSVGDKPLLETIVERLVGHGFHKIWIAVHYRAEKIESHFGDGSSFGTEVHYLREPKRLGTAGALSLLPPADHPVIVTNADLLVNVDYGEMLGAHMQLKSCATMGVREYEYQIPFGVVRTVDDTIAAVEEKPVHRALVNAGIYVLSPAALARVPRDTFFDMPELFAELMRSGLPVRYFLINGYWLDIGRHEDLHKANADFSKVFL